MNHSQAITQESLDKVLKFASLADAKIRLQTLLSPAGRRFELSGARAEDGGGLVGPVKVRVSEETLARYNAGIAATKGFADPKAAIALRVKILREGA